VIRSLLRRGIRQHAGLLAVLTGGLFLFEWAVVWVAARIDMGPGFRDLLGTLLPPQVVEVIFGQFGFASFGGSVSFGFQHPMALIAGTAMVMVMATCPAQERESGFLDLILSRPLTRARYLTAAALLSGIAAILPSLGLLAGCAVGLAVVDSPQAITWTRYLAPAAMLALLLATVGSYVLLLATGARRRGVAIAQAVGITLLFYWLDFMGAYWELLATARRLSPFHYFDPAGATNLFPTADAAVLSVVVVAAVAGAFFNFRRQNL
jgi:ABC-2 type transport system permease protein